MKGRNWHHFDQELDSPGFFANPYPLFNELRNEAPVFWSEVLNSWVLTRYDDVVASLLDSRRFSSADRMTTLLDHLPEDTRENVRLVDQHYAATLPFLNPPEHTRVRGLVNKTFTPCVVEGMRSRIQAIADQLMDSVQNKRRMDIICDFAFPLPVMVISALVGVPVRDRENFKRWTNEIFAIFSSGRARAASTEFGMQSLIEARSYLSRLVAERRKYPREDLISYLIAVEEKGNTLTAEQLLANVVTLFVAGHETTTNMIGLSVLSLLNHPGQLCKLRSDPSLMIPAVEELLRYDGSLLRNWRVAKEDMEIRGQHIHRGQMVSQMLGAANRDPEYFPTPDRLDICRQNNRHVAFGYGIHYCLGAPLARLELEIAIATIVRRIPKLQPGEGTIEWREDYTFRGMKTLPVNF